jgi:hypothetical protein
MKSFIRETRRKDKALTKIREDLDDWSAGRSTPVQRFFVTAWVFMILTGGGLFLHYWPAWGWIFLAAWSALSNLLLRKLIPRKTESWEAVFDETLSSYKPVNQAAWERLKLQVEREGLTLAAVRSWFQEEAISVWPEERASRNA